MKLIFLDIDGVVNSVRFAIDNYEKTGHGLFLYENVDSSAVETLVGFLKKHNDVGLVISSSWRRSTYKDTVDFFNKHEQITPLADYIVGVTPRLYNGVRGDDIEWFVDNLSTPIVANFVKDENLTNDGYCIVDDEDDMLDYQRKVFVHVDGEFGLQEHDIIRMENILYGKDK